MRLARRRDDRRNTVYEVSNRFVGGSGELEMPARGIRKFRSIVRKTTLLYTLEILTFEISEVGYSIICVAPNALPDRQTVQDHFLARYGDTREMPDFNDNEVYFHWASRIRDISCFFKDIQQMFTQWYNQILKEGQRNGTIWAGRFVNVILSSTWNFLHRVLDIKGEVDDSSRKPRLPKGLGRRLRRRWNKLLRDHSILEELPIIAGEIALLIVQQMAHPTARR